MNRKFVALLIIASIGGGFMGVSIVLAELLKVSYFTLGHFLVFGSALTLFGYFIYAGLVFASNNENNKHLRITFLLQIPWVSSPILVYKIAAGFSLSGLFHVGGFNFLYNMGSDFSFGIFNGQSWGLGLNVAAVGLYYLASHQVATVPNNNA
jgi:hypothetical protein